MPSRNDDDERVGDADLRIDRESPPKEGAGVLDGEGVIDASISPSSIILAAFEFAGDIAREGEPIEGAWRGLDAVLMLAGDASLSRVVREKGDGSRDLAASESPDE